MTRLVAKLNLPYGKKKSIKHIWTWHRMYATSILLQIYSTSKGRENQKTYPNPNHKFHVDRRRFRCKHLDAYLHLDPTWPTPTIWLAFRFESNTTWKQNLMMNYSDPPCIWSIYIHTNLSWNYASSQNQPNYTVRKWLSKNIMNSMTNIKETKDVECVERGRKKKDKTDQSVSINNHHNRKRIQMSYSKKAMHSLRPMVDRVCGPCSLCTNDIIFSNNIFQDKVTIKKRHTDEAFFSKPELKPEQRNRTKSHQSKLSTNQSQPRSSQCTTLLKGHSLKF